MEYTIEDTFDVGIQTYWDIFFSEEYGKALWVHLDIGWDLVKFEREGEGDDLVIDRIQTLTPRREVPKIIQKLVKGAITYTEHNHFVARTNRMETKTVPNFGADRVDNHGLYRLEELGPNKVNRIWEGHCSCNIPLLGGRIEKFLVQEVKDSYRRATDFTRKFHSEHA